MQSVEVSLANFCKHENEHCALIKNRSFPVQLFLLWKTDRSSRSVTVSRSFTSIIYSTFLIFCSLEGKAIEGWFPSIFSFTSNVIRTSIGVSALPAPANVGHHRRHTINSLLPYSTKGWEELKSCSLLRPPLTPSPGSRGFGGQLWFPLGRGWVFSELEAHRVVREACSEPSWSGRMCKSPGEPDENSGPEDDERKR